MAKGRFTGHENDNTTSMVDVSRQAAEITKQASALAMAQNKHRYSQADVYEIMRKCAEYVEEQRTNKKPLTVAGFILASGVPASTWYDAKEGRLDTITALYQMEHGDAYTDEETGEQMALVPFSDAVKTCYLLLQEQLEGNCYNVKAHNVAGSIFGLKAQYGWSDDTTPQSVTQNLVICDAEQARKALKMLSD